MPRGDKYFNILQNVKPDYYAQTEHGTIFIWIRPDYNIAEKPFISAYFNGPNPPLRFHAHYLSEQPGTYLFRKKGQRIYPADLIPFPSTLWTGNILEIPTPYPHYFKPYY